jgi:hypothetical protein
MNRYFCNLERSRTARFQAVLRSRETCFFSSRPNQAFLSDFAEHSGAHFAPEWDSAAVTALSCHLFLNAPCNPVVPAKHAQLQYPRAPEASMS